MFGLTNANNCVFRSLDLPIALESIALCGAAAHSHIVGSVGPTIKCVEHHREARALHAAGHACGELELAQRIDGVAHEVVDHLGEAERFGIDRDVERHVSSVHVRVREERRVARRAELVRPCVLCEFTREGVLRSVVGKLVRIGGQLESECDRKVEENVAFDRALHHSAEYTSR